MTDALKKYTRERWPLSNALFMMLRRRISPVRGIRIASINHALRVIHIGTNLYEFWEQLEYSSSRFICQGDVSCIAQTEVGKEMDALEKEVDLYVRRDLADICGAADDSLYVRCFNLHLVDGKFVAQSIEGCVKWFVFVDPFADSDDIATANDFIIARKKWLAGMDALRELPQPIAEEIIEQFEFCMAD